jgi:hypothetical protein
VILPYEDGPSTLDIDVRAPTPEAAVERATELYQRIRSVAELPADDHPQVVTVAEVAGVPYPADVFIFAADEMLSQHQFALAVVAAQIHCEMSISQAIARVAGKQNELAELAPALPGAWSLQDRVGSRIFEAVLGVRPTTFPDWERYKTHVARRNAVVHRGAPVTRELASESIDVAVAMVRFVDEQVQAVEGQDPDRRAS